MAALSFECFVLEVIWAIKSRFEICSWPCNTPARRDDIPFRTLLENVGWRSIKYFLLSFFYNISATTELFQPITIAKIGCLRLALPKIMIITVLVLGRPAPLKDHLQQLSVDAICGKL